MASEPERKKHSREIVRLTAGWIFLGLGVFLLVAFVSYLFNWTVDQSLLSGDNLLIPEDKAANSGGFAGNRLANLFIGQLFGLSAFIIPFFCVAVSVFLLKIRSVRIIPLFFTTAFVCIILSIALGYIFSFTSLRYVFGAGIGGTYGYRVNEWLISILGTVGTGVVLFFILTAIPLPFIYRLIQKRKEKRQAAPLSEPAPSEFEVESVAGVPVKKEVPVTPAAPVPPLPVFEVEKTGETSTSGKMHFYDPKQDLSHYKKPPLDLLEDYKNRITEVPQEELERNNQKIVECLRTFDIQIEKIVATPGPTVTLYKIVLSPGIRISQFTRLEDDIMLSLAARGMRVIAPIPGTNMVGIEVANDKPSLVPMKSVLDSTKFKESKDDLPIVLGKSISNEIVMLDLARLPHLLVAGATGQGKSVALNAILTSLLYKMHPAYLKLVLVDPKRVELNLYSKLENHFLARLPDADSSIIIDTKKVVYTLNSLCIEMDNRLELYNMAGVRNIKEYNKKFQERVLNPLKGHRFMPFIVLIIDEFADLIMTAGRDVEGPLTRLAQMGRATGIHLVIATQRPTTNIITGTIKANFPARMAFRVASKIDSRVIIDVSEASQLVGRGDMLISAGTDLQRVQCAFIDTREVERMVDFIGDQPGYSGPFELPEYSETDRQDMLNPSSGQRDELFEEAARLLIQNGEGSTSLLQRRFHLGYNRAGRIMDQLEEAGIVGPPRGSNPRELLISSQEMLDDFLKK
ncbi:MAG TPA: DNA translocase FtsK 4TM domain-containing protein [Bacteroidales bacterium]|jgi:S-DNA-T family DNA segregation ATPase FtsK/SpoIIIE|nr:MAG: DNA translocase SpoIIIE [Bacteroidetes bacterium ADurb.Bin139]HOG25388.1 DNA translocase FtsK 4TM domain-containing protein [Bacteroidales bacterium]HOR10852.1 DNA translocase FtsK 4TM domain-containing protein [Bacteroidales bacterium]HOZ19257.1 DNA translocase FtsK 4TM domain-containing protein [Bacteroidales bacterium]HPB77284.1 DNA translocase FtsK 4TM domain-containing protein [Bacteroidales bacterium]